MSIQDIIKQQISENPVILYMKGSVELPKCGFSSRAVNLLKACGVAFAAIDVLQDEAIRQGIKIYSNWPTIPQLYINGDFIGGSDIMDEMAETGELQQLIDAIA
ncbi:MAG: monothiol glutaredoxin, Grx4 family [Gammaproteobacteria bacterium RIFCSPHIGHO2_12_FULL_42_10]|nr:MAG: monothiol glutaredoxin, Grx4 family [Gammaproteobacteria bacterium RIFCSPHIGHO2_12_FULL_42_10]